MTTDIDLHAIRSELLKSGFDAEALDALSGIRTTAPAPPDPVAGFPDPDLLLHAALSGTFLPGQLTRKRKTGAVDHLLAVSETVVVGMGRAWQLRPDIRRQAILGAAERADLSGAIERTEPIEGDEVGAMLRRILGGETFALDTLPLDELDSLVQVVEWLAPTEIVSSLPEIEDIRRVQQRRELIEPFLTLVGRPLDQPEDASRDRFVGREREIERLRAYVGIVPPEQLTHYLKRGLTSLWSTIGTGPERNEPLRIEGAGGAGKSTLIAKFILDHALIPGIRLPFMYLDFDRATITAREPLQLLIDLTLQMSTWLPEATTPLREFRRDLRRSIEQQARNASHKRRERKTWSELRGHCQHFRDIVENVNRAEAPVILLLDTFELVQYNAEAVAGIQGLIDSLRTPLGGPWANLRIVVAGRGSLRQIKSSQPVLAVGPLTIEATRKLIGLRSAQADLALTDEQVAALARPLRNSPLDVVIVTRWLKQNRDKATQFISEVVGDRELETSPADATDGAEARVTALLVHRMIDHIADRQVRDLALPGFVVRTISPEVIRDVMIPARGKAAKVDSASATTRAQKLFERLRREQWLVVRQGKMLRHRADVRRAMLRLMQERDRDEFYQTNKAAIAFFSERAEERVERAEAIYHLLLAEPPQIEEAEELWRPELASLLATGVDDLGDRARDYLRIRLGHSYSIESLGRMPARVLEAVLASAGQQILERIGPEGFLDLLQARSDTRASADERGLVAEARYRTGRWPLLAEDAARDHFELVERGRQLLAEPMPHQQRGHGLRHLVLLGTRDPALDRYWAEAMPTIAGTIAELKGSLFWDLAALIACWHRRFPNADGGTILDLVAERCRTPESMEPEVRGGAALRILALLEPPDQVKILGAVDLQTHFATVSAREFDLFRKAVFGGGDEDDVVARGRELIGRVEAMGEDQILLDPRLTADFGAIAGGLLQHGPPFVRAAAIRELLFLTHPDWLEPLGLALTRAYGGEVPTRLGWFSSIDALLGEEAGGSKRAAKGMTGHQILSLADEAGQLIEAVDAYREHLSSRGPVGEPDDFLYLAARLAEWIELIRPIPPLVNSPSPQ